MAENGTLTFSDPDGYAAGFGDAHINLTITGAGDFKARLTRLKLKDLEVYRCCESLPRIAYISLPPQQMFLSFPVGAASLIFDGFALRNDDIVSHGRGERTHQRSNGACQWGLISLSPDQFASCGKALTGQAIAPPHVSRILRPVRAEVLRFQRLFAQACRLAEAAGQQLIERPEAARALEQELLHAVINCLAANETSPARYLLLQRLNKARGALRRADPSTASVAEVARNHQFLELGRFAVTYRTTFGESPSATLQRDPQT
jgi:AraC-like DNA-binding protein